MTMGSVKRFFQSDITKTLLFFILTITAAAITSPWLYNVGMFLAEVGEVRHLNRGLNWLATKAADNGFPAYYKMTLVICAMLLAGPFIMWMNLANKSSQPIPGPWRIKLPRRSLVHDSGQPLCHNPTAKLHLATGFLLTGGLLTLAVWLLLTLGWFSLDHPVEWAQAMRAALVSAAVLALVKEWLFRGMMLGIFLRSMRPAPAIVAVSLLYALIHLLLPNDTVHIANPDKADAGFRLLGLMCMQIMNLREFVFSLLSLTAVGLILGYARYRTASLWLPVGLHAGWVFSHQSLQQITMFDPDNPPLSGLLIGTDGISGLLPLFLLITTGLLVHVFARISNLKRQAEA